MFYSDIVHEPLVQPLTKNCIFFYLYPSYGQNKKTLIHSYIFLIPDKSFNVISYDVINANQICIDIVDISRSWLQMKKQCAAANKRLTIGPYSFGQKRRKRF